MPAASRKGARTMSADMIRLSVQPFGPFAYRPSSPAGSAGPSGAPDEATTHAAPVFAGSGTWSASAGGSVPQPVKAPRVRPAWPDPGTIYLAAELLDLSKTTIAYTGTFSLPNTGADFWALLASALGEGRKE